MDFEVNQAEWVAARSGEWPELRVFAFDHRMQFETLDGATPDKIGRFKRLCLDAALKVADGRPGHGLLCDSRLGRDALAKATGTGLWIARPVEWPGSYPLTLEPEVGPGHEGLASWPKSHVVKVLCFCHPDDTAEIWASQQQTVRDLFRACRENGLEFLLEVIPSKLGPVEDDTAARLIRRFYALGVFPDWWKLEPMRNRAAWEATSAAIAENDPHCRGIVVLGLGESEATLAASFAAAARVPLVKGFAVGRTIFADVAEGWMRGAVSDEMAVTRMAENYARLCAVWDKARAVAPAQGRQT